MRYPVKDLPVAAYLAYRRIEMCAPYDNDLKSWIFDDRDGNCADLELEVRNGKAMASVSEYESVRKNLLGMVRHA